MKLSWNWLKTLVPLEDVTPKNCADALTLSGSKVETLERLGADVSGVVVGRAVSVEKHPDADRLSVCMIDVGAEKPLQIVTGASNVTPGALVPAALDGAKLPGGKEIHSGVMRGAASEGMLCSIAELGLSQHDEPDAEDGIFILGEDALPLGRDIRGALELSDTVIEFEITNNRPDCLSAIGLARETAATLGRELTIPEVSAGGGDGNVESMLSVRVDDPALCPRYTARVITDVKIGPSPRWMRRRLRSCGVRPINNIVDITNYVMLEYGQPMHAFDRACLKDFQIIVRRAAPGESLQTLDGQPRKLLPDMLAICDPSGPVAVAGVMGGASSEITQNTKTIVFESATFDGPSVRKTALALAMRTDSSSRFEKGLDPHNTVRAVERACQLVEMLGAGRVVGGMIDVCGTLPAQRVIPLDAEKINTRLGTTLSDGAMTEMLARLGFECEADSVKIPSWRSDVKIFEDLSEEIARLHGYDKIPETLATSTTQGMLTKKQSLDKRLRDTCIATGFCEMLTYSFTSPRDLDKIRVPDGSPLRSRMTLLNPLGEDTSVMRTSALPSLLGALAKNSAARNPEALLFELATVYMPKEGGLPKEIPHLVLGGYASDLDFSRMKGVTELIADVFRLDARYEPQSENPSFHPGRCAVITAGGREIGVLGEIPPDVLAAYDISGRVCACELDIPLMYAAMRPEAQYAALPRFPAMTRDLALICPADMPAARIKDVIISSGGVLLADCSIFDVYTGKQVAENTKSVAFALTFRAPDRTLRDAEADEAVAGILAGLEKELGIKIRA